MDDGKLLFSDRGGGGVGESGGNGGSEGGGAFKKLHRGAAIAIDAT